MPVDGFTGFAAASGAANIGSFVFDTLNYFDKRSKKYSELDKLLEQTGENIGGAHKDVLTNRATWNPREVKGFVEELTSCTDDHSQNIIMQRQAHIGKLPRSKRKAYESGVRKNDNRSHNLLLKAKVNSQIALNHKLAREIEQENAQSSSEDISDNHRDSSTPVSEQPASDETLGRQGQTYSSLETEAGQLVEQSKPSDPFLDSTSPQGPPINALGIELRSMTLESQDMSWAEEVPNKMEL